jgi:hypothetical protein
MGNGLTFPTETLVFYVIVKAIAELSEVRGLISVYGDDLIYPSGLHKYVAAIFPQLKFKLNLDKTFVKAPFRESCGSDFYRGVDVRPAFLPDEHQLLTRTKYSVWLYKTYNALIRRWDEKEISTTLFYLLTEISRIGLKVFRVPPSYPDTAGIKVLNPWVIPMDAQVLDWSPISVRFYSGSRWFSFSYLSTQPSNRAVVTTLPYYWLSLQGLTDFSDLDRSWEGIDASLSRKFKLYELLKIRDPRDLVHYSQAPRQSLLWTTLKRERIITKSDGTRYRKFVKRQLAMCPDRSAIKTVVNETTARSVSSTEPESISDWF